MGSKVYWPSRTQLNELERDGRMDVRTTIEKPPVGWPLLGPAKTIMRARAIFTCFKPSDIKLSFKCFGHMKKIHF